MFLPNLNCEESDKGHSGSSKLGIIAIRCRPNLAKAMNQARKDRWTNTPWRKDRWNNTAELQLSEQDDILSGSVFRVSALALQRWFASDSTSRYRAASCGFPQAS